MAHDILAQYLSANEGTRLPPERQLAEQLGMSRNEVRKTLARLEAEGRLSREVGRGTFLRKPPEQAIDPSVLQRTATPREAMQARLLIEPELASLAAINASFQQIEDMRALSKKMRDAENWAAYEQLDVQFHRAIAEAAGNKLLVAVHEIVNDVRRVVIWKWLDTRPKGPPPEYSSFAEHDAIIAAIEKRDRNGAMDAMRRHLTTTSARLIGTSG